MVNEIKGLIFSQNIQMKTKMLEARFHEEKLKLQQRHDVAVQKVSIKYNVKVETHQNSNIRCPILTINKQLNKQKFVLKIFHIYLTFLEKEFSLGQKKVMKINPLVLRLLISFQNLNCQ